MTTETTKPKGVRTPRRGVKHVAASKSAAVDAALTLTAKQESDIAMMVEYTAELTSSKAKAVAFLKRAGILDGKGKLAKAYHS